MSELNWQPSASFTALRARASVLNTIRQFFAVRDVLEVDTPAMSQAAVTDVHLDAFSTVFVGPGYSQGLPLYLQTSPEFHMKRLLAAGSGCIYQMSKSFRNEEAGRHHNPEFTMLEWYRIGFDHFQLMDEMSELLTLVLGSGKEQRFTYQNAFKQFLQLDPLTASMDELRNAAKAYNVYDVVEHETDRDTILQLLFYVGVESQIGQGVPCFIYDFPASQAALARISQQDTRVAERFEVYFKGIELANGFHELADAKEQLARFIADNNKRKTMDLPQQPIDHHLIDALAAGFPDCAGVALGIDRLVMLATGANSLADVLAFPTPRA